MAFSTTDAALESIAIELIAALKHQFPVCLSSDEFHYFPQAVAEVADGAAWDDFSDDAVDVATRRLSGWETALDELLTRLDSPADRIDAAIFRQICTTLREQLSRSPTHRSQPSFHLTVLAIGLAEALEAGGKLWRLRIEEVPCFLERARKCLRVVPRLFQAMGVEMASKIGRWLASLKGRDGGIGAAVTALADFEAYLHSVAASEEFRIDPEAYARVAAAHIGCAMSVPEIIDLLDGEIEETRRLLEKESGRLNPERSWQEAAAALDQPITGGALEARYAEIIERLGRHCMESRMVSSELIATTPIRVTPVPAHLTPVRSVAAYSMPPGHPPRGGTFFTDPDRGSSLPGDWQLLTAHETYPGHHLLDAHRWGLERALRRHIEFPLFYEGWASFSEELLFDTGFFGGGINRLLMAKRRFWRALRGRADAALHWERKSIDEAALLFAKEGLDKGRAEAMVRRYALKPGYQLCYTVGRAKFRGLYNCWRAEGGEPAAFVRKVMAEGEIGLERLEKVLFQL